MASGGPSTNPTGPSPRTGIAAFPAYDPSNALARLRNLLVHRYWELDHRRLFESLPGRMDALRRFKMEILAWLQKSAA